MASLISIPARTTALVFLALFQCVLSVFGQTIPPASAWHDALIHAHRSPIGPDIYSLLGTDLPIHRVWQQGPFLFVVVQEPIPGKTLVRQDVVKVVDISKQGAPRVLQTLHPLIDAGNGIVWPVTGQHAFELGTIFLREGWLYLQDLSTFQQASRYFTYALQQDGQFGFRGSHLLEGSDTAGSSDPIVTSRMYPSGRDMFCEMQVYTTSALMNLGLPLSDGYLYSRHDVQGGVISLGFPKSVSGVKSTYGVLLEQASLPENQVGLPSSTKVVHDSLLFFRNTPEWPMFNSVGSVEFIDAQEGRPPEITYEWIEVTKPIHRSHFTETFTNFIDPASLNIPMRELVTGMIPTNQKLSGTLDLGELLLNALPLRSISLMDLLRGVPGFDENLDRFLRNHQVDRNFQVRTALQAIVLRQLEGQMESVVADYFNQAFGLLAVNKTLKSTLSTQGVTERWLTFHGDLRRHLEDFSADDFLIDFVFEPLVQGLPHKDETLGGFVERASDTWVGEVVGWALGFIRYNPFSQAFVVLFHCEFPIDLSDLIRTLSHSWDDGIQLRFENRLYYEGIKLIAHYAGVEGWDRVEAGIREQFTGHLEGVQGEVFAAVDPFVARAEKWTGVTQSFSVGIYNKKILAWVADRIADHLGLLLQVATNDSTILDRSVLEATQRFGLQVDYSDITFEKLLSVREIGEFLSRRMDVLFEGLNLDLATLGEQNVLEGVIIDYFRKVFPELNLNQTLYDNLLDYLLRQVGFLETTQGMVGQTLGHLLAPTSDGALGVISHLIEDLLKQIIPINFHQDCWINLIQAARLAARALELQVWDISLQSLVTGINMDLMANAAEQSIKVVTQELIQQGVQNFISEIISARTMSGGSVDFEFSAKTRRQVAKTQHSLETLLAPYVSHPIHFLGARGEGDTIVSLLQVMNETKDLLVLRYDRVTQRHTLQFLGAMPHEELRYLTTPGSPNPQISQGFLGVGNAGVLSGYPSGAYFLDLKTQRAVLFAGADWNPERILVSEDRELAILWSAHRLQVGILPVWSGLTQENEARGLEPAVESPPAEIRYELGNPIDLRLRVRGSRPLSFFWKHEGGTLIPLGDSLAPLVPDSSFLQGSYRLVVTNAFGSAESSPVVMTQTLSCMTDLHLGLVTNTLTLREGTPLSVPVFCQSEQFPLRYVLQRGGSLVQVSTNSTLQFDAVQRSDSGIYTVQVQSRCGERVAGQFQLQVIPKLPLPAGAVPTFSNLAQLCSLTLLFDQVRMKDLDSSSIQMVRSTEEMMASYDSRRRWEFVGILEGVEYPFMDRMSRREEHPLEADEIFPEVIQISIAGPQSAARWVLKESQDLKDFRVLHEGRGETNLVLRATSAGRFYTIEAIPNP